MSKYSKHLAQKAYRNQTRLNNRMHVQRYADFKQMSETDERSTFATFKEWMKECADQGLFIDGNILSIWGSDGITVNENGLGRAPKRASWNQPKFVDFVLEDQGYYEEDLSLAELPYHKPKMT